MIIAVVTVVCTVIAALIGIAAWWRSGKERQAAFATIQILTTMQPLTDRVHTLESYHSPDARDKETLILKAVVSEALHPIEQNLAQIGVKVETLWTNLPVVMAQVLHKPDPNRAEVDRLLEAFIEGTLTNDERVELRKHLVVIKNWEPGMESPYPIDPGEQIAAAILLITMDDPAKGK